MTAALAIVRIFRAKGEIEARMKGHSIQEIQPLLDTWGQLDCLEEVFFDQDGELAPHQEAALEELLQA